MSKRPVTVEQHQTTEVIATEQRPAWLVEKSGPSRGMEEVTAKDVIIPRLELIQATSPARDKTNPLYIEGAEEGMLFNSVTRELYGTSVVIAPVVYKKQYLVWKSRKLGGGSNGFRGAFDHEIDAKAEIDRLAPTEQGLESVETAQHFCLLVRPNGSVEEVVLSMAKTKLKVSRRWNSLMRMAEDDSFSRVYHVSSILETNSRNEKFYNLSVTPAGYAPQGVYVKGEATYNQIRGGSVVVSQDFEDTAGSSDQEGEF